MGELDHKESWGLKNWCFWTVVLEKTLESPLDCKEIQPVHPKGDQPEFSLKGLMLKLKLQYFGHLMRRPDSMEKTLLLGKIEGRRRRGWQRMGWLDDITIQWTWVWANSEDGEGQGSLACCSLWGHRVRHNLATEHPRYCPHFRHQPKIESPGYPHFCLVNYKLGVPTPSQVK